VITSNFIVVFVETDVTGEIGRNLWIFIDFIWG